MSLRLILVRHAKSSWDDPMQIDHERPLNGRGRRSADAIGDWLRERGYLPDLVLCSTAARTRETLERMRLEAETAYFDALYHAAPRGMLEVLRNNGRGDCVMLVGHNPGCATFASQLVTRAPEHPRFGGYPTAATLVADLPAQSWSEASFFSAEARDFIVPRDLTD